MQIAVKCLFLIVLSAIAAYPQPPENRTPENVYLAKDDGSGKPGEEATEFAPTDIPIHCVVVLGDSTPVTVKMDLVAVSVAGVKRESSVISTTYKTKERQNQVNFNGKPYGLWVAGDYRADIYIDGYLVGRYPFRVKGIATTPKPSMNLQPKQPVRSRSATAKRT